MDNLSKVNLDASNYSNLELREILGLDNVTNSDTIQEHISKIELSTLNDEKLSFNNKNKIVSFLNSAKFKLTNDNINMLPDTKIDLTYGAQTNYMIPNTPLSNPLIHAPNTLGSSKAEINAGRGEYYPAGYLNPINIRTTKKIINLDSRFRNAYYNTKSSDFHLDLPETYKKIVNMQLSSYQIPTTIYGVNGTNNFFHIMTATNVVKKIDISNGNYFTHNSVDIDLSQNIQNSITDSINSNGLSSLISFKINTVTGRSEITNKVSNQELRIFFNRDTSGDTIVETPLPFKLGWLLGYRAGEYILQGGEKLISEGIANFDVPKYLYISINDFTQASHNNFAGTFSESIISEHLIAKINYGSLITDNKIYQTHMDDDPPNFIRTYFGPVDIKKLHIKILDEYGRIVDLNNMDWSFTIILDSLYD